MRTVRITNRKNWLCSVNGTINKCDGSNSTCPHKSINLNPVECMAHGNVKCDFRLERTEADIKLSRKNHLALIYNRNM